MSVSCFYTKATDVLHCTPNGVITHMADIIHCWTTAEPINGEMMFGARKKAIGTPATIEMVRKQAKILVIDDQDWPAMAMFDRDGYHIERWPEIKNLTQLTDGHFQLILLDINGVGLVESPDLQGLGILEAIKNSNPAQTVIVYSAQKQRISASKYLERADAVLDKSTSYVDFKLKIDQLLLARSTPDYFIAMMNGQLGEHAALVPDAVSRALKSMKTGDIEGLRKYLSQNLPDKERVELALNVISAGAAVLGALSGI